MPDTFGDGIMLMGGTGTLSGDGVSADYLGDAAGFFVGGTGEGLPGDHISEVLWSDGPNTGTTSWSDGLQSATAAE